MRHIIGVRDNVSESRYEALDGDNVHQVFPYTSDTKGEAFLIALATLQSGIKKTIKDAATTLAEMEVELPKVKPFDYKLN